MQMLERSVNVCSKQGEVGLLFGAADGLEDEGLVSKACIVVRPACRVGVGMGVEGLRGSEDAWAGREAGG